MPYARNDELPDEVRDALPSEAQSVFRNVVNESLENSKSESDAFAAAWAAVKNGWEKRDDSWVRKSVEPRVLRTLDEPGLSHVPFSYDGQILGTLREDQIPRFFGALTDPRSLPVADFPFATLTAMQDRISTEKVEAIRNSPDKSGKKPLVVVHNGKSYIADGHHRAVAQWLDGGDSLKAHYKDISPVTNAVKSAETVTVAKVSDELGIVFGWGIICKVHGEDFWDSQADHISEDVMMAAAVTFVKNGAVAKEMHVGEAKGTVVFVMPMTTELAKSYGISTDQTGLMIGMKPDSPEMLQKFRDGTYTGFSIGGTGERVEVS